MCAPPNAPPFPSPSTLEKPVAREGLPNLVFERSYGKACRYLCNVRPGLGGALPHSSPHARRYAST